MIDLFMTTGPTDVMVISEIPKAGDVVALAMAIAASGAVETIQTIQAWSPEDFEAIAGKAASIAAAHSPPGA